MKTNKGGYWNTRKEKLLKMYQNLSQKDLNFKVGEENAMLALLSDKLGKSNQELLKMIIMLWCLFVHLAFEIQKPIYKILF